MADKNADEGQFPSEDDIYEALQDLPGYLDVTPGDLKELFRLAWRHAEERLYGKLKVRELMTADVLAVGRDTPVKELAEAMAARAVSGVPVVDEDRRVVGVVSEKDFFRRLSSGRAATAMAFVAEALRRGTAQLPALGGGRAEDLMTSPPVIVREDAPVRDVLALLRRRGVNRLPVVTAEGRLVGIVTRGDLIGFRSECAP